MEENKYYSVQEFAKEVGVSRQTIYNALSNKLSNYVVTCKGVKMLRAEALCEYNYTKDIQKFDNLDKQLYKILQEELNHKNKLIDELRIEFSEERKHSREQADKLATLASQAQYLQLKQKTGQENNSVPIVEQPVEIQKESPKEKRQFWKKISENIILIVRKDHINLWKNNQIYNL